MLQKIKNIYHLTVSFLANIYYGFPGQKLTVIGVTGTSGKTTTAHMIYEILKKSGKKVSLSSTIKAVIGGEDYDTGFHVTTPDPQTLPKYLKKAVNCADEYFVIEVSSHALDQNRVAFINFKAGVLTTLAHEHLDYHKTFLNYAKAKFKLLEKSEVAIIPNKVYEEPKLKGLFKKIKGKIITFGINNGNEIQDKWKFKLKLPGDYNIMNALAASSVAKVLNIPEEAIKSCLREFSGIPGRFEEIKNDKKFRIIIDFAHKPDAIEEVLLAARNEIGKKGRIIIMYGCASQRDVLKRPLMGKISGKLAEISVLTDEDPRFEDPMKIINEIAEGCLEVGAKEKNIENTNFSQKTNIFFKIPDRKEAIYFILKKLVQKGDIILLCGKGHEKSMSYNGMERPWSEHKVVKEALQS